MARPFEKCLDIGFFHDMPGIHHDDALADLGHNAKVVGDQQDRHAEFRLEPGQEIEDLGLDGDIQCRRRFVGDEQSRVTGKRHRDHRALS